MKIKRKSVVLVVVLLADLALAATAFALNRQQAAAAATSKAFWKSGCGGYWGCTGAVVNNADGPYAGTTQWRVYVTVFREHNALKQTCQWMIPLKSNGAWASAAQGSCRTGSGGGSPVAQ